MIHRYEFHRMLLRMVCRLAAWLLLSVSAVSATEPEVVTSLDALRARIGQDNANVRLKPGVYTLDRADSCHFLRFNGRNSRFNLRGVTLRVDTALFSRFGVPKATDNFYCVVDLAGDGIVFEGAKIETFGDRPGIQSKNKIVNVTGSGVVVRDLDITTAGSSPWGYGSLFGISGGPVRKMNGIRVGWPAKGSMLIGCRVHMRAMGHGIFVQGADGTLIEDCHVDGLLKTTDEILAEKSGPAFERGFKASGCDYVEGVKVGPSGEILPGETISLSEDGIRLYDKGGVDHATGRTTIRRCTVSQMRRGFCTGLGPARDTVIDCEARDCVAAGFNIGTGDTLERCHGDAKFSEALSCPYRGSKGSRVDLEILDSRGAPNDLLATLNGSGHTVRLSAARGEFVPDRMIIAEGTCRGYAIYQKQVPLARGIRLVNETAARVIEDSPPVSP